MKPSGSNMMFKGNLADIMLLYLRFVDEHKWMHTTLVATPLSLVEMRFILIMLRTEMAGDLQNCIVVL